MTYFNKYNSNIIVDGKSLSAILGKSVLYNNTMCLNNLNRNYSNYIYNESYTLTDNEEVILLQTLKNFQTMSAATIYNRVTLFIVGYFIGLGDSYIDVYYNDSLYDTLTVEAVPTTYLTTYLDLAYEFNMLKLVVRHVGSAVTYIRTISILIGDIDNEATY